jgi:hypothetical protein
MPHRVSGAVWDATFALNVSREAWTRPECGCELYLEPAGMMDDAKGYAVAGRDVRSD